MTPGCQTHCRGNKSTFTNTMISVIKVLLNGLDRNITNYNHSSTFSDRIDSSLKVFIVTVYINLVWVASEEENTCNPMEVFEEVTTQLRY